MNPRHFLLVTFLMMAPASTEAAVTINEVAWMGDLVSANHEWIELYHSGEDTISLSGWTLTDGNNLTIALSGSIAGGGYAVLERTSEDSAPGTALLLYSGALVNTGATLRLLDADGQLVDQVAGGENWAGIGGDNTSKETAQYTTSGWITAVATPGAPNAVGLSPVETSPVVSGGSGTVVASEVRAPIVLNRESKTDLSLSLTIPQRVSVGQKIDLAVSIVGVGEQIAPSTKYQWNFGDTYTAEGKTPTHEYLYPGTYVLTVTAEVAGRKTYVEREVTVLPLMLSLTRNKNHAVQLHNDAVYAVDVSGYTIRGNKSITLPPATIIAPRGTITIASDRLETTPGQSFVMLFDGQGNGAASLNPHFLERQADQDAVVKAISVARSPAPETLPDLKLEVDTVATTTEVSASTATSELLAASVTATDDSVPAIRHYYIGLFLILLGALLALFTIPRRITGPQNSGL